MKIQKFSIFYCCIHEYITGLPSYTGPWPPPMPTCAARRSGIVFLPPFSQWSITFWAYSWNCCSSSASNSTFLASCASAFCLASFSFWYLSSWYSIEFTLIEVHIIQTAISNLGFDLRTACWTLKTDTPSAFFRRLTSFSFSFRWKISSASFWTAILSNSAFRSFAAWISASLIYFGQWRVMTVSCEYLHTIIQWGNGTNHGYSMIASLLHHPSGSLCPLGIFLSLPSLCLLHSAPYPLVFVVHLHLDLSSQFAAYSLQVLLLLTVIQLPKLRSFISLLFYCMM